MSTNKTKASMVDYKRPGSGSVEVTSDIKLNLEYNVREYGVVPDGSDIAPMLREAAANVPAGAVLNFDIGKYRVASLPAGQDYTTQWTKQITLKGKSLHGTVLSPAHGTVINWGSQIGATADIWRFRPTADYLYKFLEVSNIAFMPDGFDEGNPDISGLTLYGRNIIHIYTPDVGQTFRSSKIKTCILGPCHGRSIMIENNQILNVDGGWKHCVVGPFNWIWGGIKMDGVGDNNSVIENEFAGERIGLDFRIAPGASQLLFSHNSGITRRGAIKIRSGPRTKILYNNFEQILVHPGAADDATAACIYDLAGSSTTIGAAIVEGNYAAALINGHGLDSLIRSNNSVADMFDMNSFGATFTVPRGIDARSTTHSTFGTNMFNNNITTPIDTTGATTPHFLGTTITGWVL